MRLQAITGQIQERLSTRQQEVITVQLPEHSPRLSKDETKPYKMLESVWFWAKHKSSTKEATAKKFMTSPRVV